jgi:hypothetical protein
MAHSAHMILPTNAKILRYILLWTRISVPQIQVTTIKPLVYRTYEL